MPITVSGVFLDGGTHFTSEVLIGRPPRALPGRNRTIVFYLKSPSSTICAPLSPSTSAKWRVMTSDDRKCEEWEQLIGRAVSSFAEIELITYHCLKHIPRDNIFPTVSRLPFGRRVDLILGILDGLDGLPDVGEKFKENLQKAGELAEVRNLIAHNPTMRDVYEWRSSERPSVANPRVTTPTTGSRAMRVRGPAFSTRRGGCGASG